MAELMPSVISRQTLSRLLSLYPTTAINAYRVKRLQKSHGLTKGEKARRKKQGIRTVEPDPTIPRPGEEQEMRKFSELDTWRYETLPAIVRERRDLEPEVEDPASKSVKKAKIFAKSIRGMAKKKYGTDLGDFQNVREGDANLFLDKDELTKLMDWKLKHGTFRPTLLGLLKTNPPALIKSATRTAFNDLPNPTKTGDGFPQESMKRLTGQLKGIGPATASLILSAGADAAYNGDSGSTDRASTEIPFFSDELYGWLVTKSFPAPRRPKVEPGRKVRPTEYTMNSYKLLFRAVNELMERVNGSEELAGGKGDAKGPFSAMDIEKIGFVVGNLDLSGYNGPYQDVVIEPFPLNHPAKAEEAEESAEQEQEQQEEEEEEEEEEEDTPAKQKNKQKGKKRKRS